MTAYKKTPTCPEKPGDKGKRQVPAGEACTGLMREKTAFSQGSAAERIRRNDLVLIAFLALVSVLLLVFPILTGTQIKSPALLIRVNGKEYGTYPLSQNREIEINGTNVCRIKDGEVQMVSADCPDGICLQASPIGKKGGSIVCLPNKVVLSIVNAQEGEEGGGLDGVAR